MIENFPQLERRKMRQKGKAQRSEAIGGTEHAYAGAEM